MMEWLIELGKQYGPWMAMCAFFVWQSWVRENRLAVALAEAYKFTTGTMQTCIDRNTSAFQEFANIITKCPGPVDPETAPVKGRR